MFQKLHSLRFSILWLGKKGPRVLQKNIANFASWLQWLQMTRNDTKWFEMTPYDSKWLEMTQNDSKWHEMTRKWLEMTQNDSKWLEMTEMTRNDFLWFIGNRLNVAQSLIKPPGCYFFNCLGAVSAFYVKSTFLGHNNSVLAIV